MRYLEEILKMSKEERVLFSTGYLLDGADRASLVFKDYTNQRFIELIEELKKEDQPSIRVLFGTILRSTIADELN